MSGNNSLIRLLLIPCAIVFGGAEECGTKTTPEAEYAAACEENDGRMVTISTVLGSTIHEDEDGDWTSYPLCPDGHFEILIVETIDHLGIYQAMEIQSRCDFYDKIEVDNTNVCMSPGEYMHYTVTGYIDIDDYNANEEPEATVNGSFQVRTRALHADEGWIKIWQTPAEDEEGAFLLQTSASNGATISL